LNAASLEIDNLWKVQNNIATGQDFVSLTWRPENFHSIDALTTFDQAVTGNTRQDVFCFRETESSSIETAVRK
jgi:hypothetical protein